jgi:hypothetical protein
MEVLELIQHGSALAGEVPAAAVFQSPCLSTLERLERDASRRNAFVLPMIKRSGDFEAVAAVAQDTVEEIDRGWADGPWPFHSPGTGCHDISTPTPNSLARCA